MLGIDNIVHTRPEHVQLVPGHQRHRAIEWQIAKRLPDTGRHLVGPQVTSPAAFGGDIEVVAGLQITVPVIHLLDGEGFPGPDRLTARAERYRAAIEARIHPAATLRRDIQPVTALERNLHRVLAELKNFA